MTETRGSRSKTRSAPNSSAHRTTKRRASRIRSRHELSAWDALAVVAVADDRRHRLERVVARKLTREPVKPRERPRPPRRLRASPVRFQVLVAVADPAFVRQRRPPQTRREPPTPHRFPPGLGSGVTCDDTLTGRGAGFGSTRPGPSDSSAPCPIGSACGGLNPPCGPLPRPVNASASNRAAIFERDRSSFKAALSSSSQSPSGRFKLLTATNTTYQPNRTAPDSPC